MYYFDYGHTAKGLIKYKDHRTGTIKSKKAPTCKNRFHYITRTAHYAQHKDDQHETIEFVESGNLPNFAQNRPDQFWEAAQLYERSNARTATSLVIALPKELNEIQRIELSKTFIHAFTAAFNFPYSCAIHNHKGAIAELDQPHLHLMYSERSDDKIPRTAEQYFKRYNEKEPQQGGAKKITADERGLGKKIIPQMRLETEIILNEYLQKYAPSKIVTVKGLRLEVPNTVSCLHHKDYNQLHGTQLKEVPMIPKSLLALDPDKKNQDEDHQAKIKKRQDMIDHVLNLREENNFELYKTHYHAKVLQLQQQKEKIAQIQDFKSKLMHPNFQPQNDKPQIEIEKASDNEQGPSFDR
jgi:ribosomal protein L14E/L6E/L27E